MFQYFILGILFVQIILPILDGLASALITWLEVLKGVATVKITAMNEQIQKMGLPETSTHVIGFAVNNEEEDDD